jgi:hypothetical protein
VLLAVRNDEELAGVTISHGGVLEKLILIHGC